MDSSPVAMAEVRVIGELEFDFNDSADGSRTDSKRSVSPREDYDPLNDCM